jgi:type IV pilus assembly protein PilZ
MARRQPREEGGVRSRVERRRSPRSPLEVRVDYSTVDAFFSEFTRDINEGGIFIETEQPAPLESMVSLRFRLPGSDEPVKVGGRVVRVSEGRAGEPPGMAIEFEHLDATARRRIDEIVRTLRSNL